MVPFLFPRFFKTLHFFFYTLHSCYLCKMFCPPFFLFKACTSFCVEKPTLFIFVTHFCIQNAVFLCLLKYCFFLSLTSILKILFFLSPELLCSFCEVARVPVFLWTTIAVRNSRELGKMPKKKVALVCKLSDPTDFTALWRTFRCCKG